jgi:hypothetical protein
MPPKLLTLADKAMEKGSLLLCLNQSLLAQSGHDRHTAKCAFGGKANIETFIMRGHYALPSARHELPSFSLPYCILSKRRCPIAMQDLTTYTDLYGTPGSQPQACQPALIWAIVNPDDRGK